MLPRGTLLTATKGYTAFQHALRSGRDDLGVIVVRQGFRLDPDRIANSRGQGGPRRTVRGVAGPVMRKLRDD